MKQSMNSSFLWMVSLIALVLGGMAFYNSYDTVNSVASLLNVPVATGSTCGISEGNFPPPRSCFVTDGGLGTGYDYIDIDDATNPLENGKIYAADPVSGQFNATLNSVASDSTIVDMPVRVYDEDGNPWYTMITP